MKIKFIFIWKFFSIYFKLYKIVRHNKNNKKKIYYTGLNGVTYYSIDA